MEAAQPTTTDRPLLIRILIATSFYSESLRFASMQHLLFVCFATNIRYESLSSVKAKEQCSRAYLCNNANKLGHRSGAEPLQLSGETVQRASVGRDQNVACKQLECG